MRQGFQFMDLNRPAFVYRTTDQDGQWFVEQKPAHGFLFNMDPTLYLAGASDSLIVKQTAERSL